MRCKHLVWVLGLFLILPAAAYASEDGDLAPPSVDEQGVLDRIKEACPEAAPGNCEKAAKIMGFLKDNPRLVRYLFRHRQWIKDHPRAARAILRAIVENRQWLADHPEIAREIYKNRRFLVRHPELVRELIERKNFLRKHPVIAQKLLEYREFARNHPELARRLRQFLENHPGLAAKIRERRGR